MVLGKLPVLGRPTIWIRLGPVLDTLLYLLILHCHLALSLVQIKSTHQPISGKQGFGGTMLFLSSFLIRRIVGVSLS